MANIKRKTGLESGPKGESGPKPVLQLKIDGPGMRKGRVPIPELVRICQEAQNAINKQAEALKKRKTYHPGPVEQSIKEECTLELIGIHGNSPTTLDFDLRKPQRALDFSDELGQRAIREIITGLRKRTDGFDPGVLLRMYTLTGVISPKLISRIDWIAPSRNGHNTKMSVAITKAVRNRLAKKLSAPRKALVEIAGVLDMADFKPEDFRCRIDTPIGASIECTFDPSKADYVQKWLRKNVRVQGEGTIHPYTDKVEVLRINEITLAPLEALADQSFFANPSLEELIAASNVKPITDPSVLAGWVPDDEDVDEMVRHIYESRK
ncbi:MAG: hypothetical protein WCA20_35260 [Candidatus Sulfotelmatobacter sp.]